MNPIFKRFVIALLFWLACLAGYAVLCLLGIKVGMMAGGGWRGA